MFRTFPSESKRVGRGSSFPRFCLLYKVALTFESVDKILKCDYSNESWGAGCFCGFCFCFSLFSLFIMIYKVVLTTEWLWMEF